VNNQSQQQHQLKKTHHRQRNYPPDEVVDVPTLGRDELIDQYEQVPTNVLDLRQQFGATDAVDTVSAHGTGTPLNDAMEAELLNRVFSARRPRVTAFKSWTGHLASA
jgi:hypothetical protein